MKGFFRALETLDDDPEERAAIQEFDGESDQELIT